MLVYLAKYLQLRQNLYPCSLCEFFYDANDSIISINST